MKTRKTKPLKIGELAAQLSALKNQVASLSKKMDYPTAEIRIKEKDGTWGDYTGVFFATDEEKLAITLGKVENHFDRYFRDIPGKEFAIFQKINNVRKLYKIIKT